MADLFQLRHAGGIALGFLLLPVGIVLIGSAFTGAGMLIDAIRPHVQEADFWTGFWGFIGVAVLGTVIAVRVIQ